MVIECVVTKSGVSWVATQEWRGRPMVCEGDTPLMAVNNMLDMTMEHDHARRVPVVAELELLLEELTIHDA